MQKISSSLRGSVDESLWVEEDRPGGPPGRATAWERAKRAWRVLREFSRRKPIGAVAGAMILGFVLVAIFAPWLAPHDPYAQSVALRLKPPQALNPLGTDQIGRDVLSRLIFGTRISLWIGLAATIFSTTVGTLLGLLSGYWGGNFDLLVQRMVDCVMAFPTLILALTIMAFLGSSMTNVILAIALVHSPRVARVVRGSVLSVKEEAYVESARAMGCSHTKILFRYILPNIMAPIIVIISINIGHVILIESSLSFLGLGTPPPAPSWGDMLSTAGQQYMVHAPWLAIFPGLAIALLVLAFNLLGDTLRDVLDPRLKGV